MRGNGEHCLGICALALGLGIFIAAVFPVGSVRLTDSAEAPETGGAAWESVETGIAGVYGWRRVT